MPKTYELISNTNVGSGGTNSITFSSIPSTYTDLVILISARSNYNANGSGISIRFNGSSSGYSYKQLYGYSGGVGSVGQTGVAQVGINVRAATATANTFSSTTVYIPNAFTAQPKTVTIDSFEEFNSTSSWQHDMFSYLWNSTDAISSITLFENNSANLVQYSNISLYGIRKS